MPTPPEEPLGPSQIFHLEPDDGPATFVSDSDRLPGLEHARMTLRNPFHHDRIGWIGARSLLVFHRQPLDVEPQPFFVQTQFLPTRGTPERGALGTRLRFQAAAQTGVAYKSSSADGTVVTVGLSYLQLLGWDTPDMCGERVEELIGDHWAKGVIPVLKALEDVLHRRPVTGTYYVTLDADLVPHVQVDRY